MQGHTAEELKATSDLVAAYFDSLEDKIAFVRTLSEQGHEDEAQLLCLVYIAGLANNLHPPGTKSGRSFSEALIRYGGDELFSLVMPDYLFENVPWKSAPLGLETLLSLAAHARKVSQESGEWFGQADWLSSGEQ